MARRMQGWLPGYLNEPYLNDIHLEIAAKVTAEITVVVVVVVSLVVVVVAGLEEPEDYAMNG